MRLLALFVLFWAQFALGVETMTLPPQVIVVKDKAGKTIPQWSNPGTNTHIEVQWVYPKSNAKKIAIMVIPGSGAGLPTDKAKEFAEMGYPALAVRYFDYNPNSQFTFSITQLPLESFSTAVKWLKGHAPVTINKVAVHGRSRGGEAALLAASYFPNMFDAILAEVPSSHVWGDRANGIWSQYIALQPDPSQETSSWTVGGKQIKFVKLKGWLQTHSYEETFNDLPMFYYREAYKYAYVKAQASDREAARIQVEKIKAPLFVTGGGKDAIWQSASFVENIRTARSNAGVGSRDVYFVAPNAGHVWSEESEPVLFPSGVYDFAKNDFSDICREENLPMFLSSIRPLSTPQPTGPAAAGGFPYAGHKNEILQTCATPNASLSYYFAPEYAALGGAPATNAKWGLKANAKIKSFLSSL